MPMEWVASGACRTRALRGPRRCRPRRAAGVGATIGDNSWVRPAVLPFSAARAWRSVATLATAGAFACCALAQDLPSGAAPSAPGAAEPTIAYQVVIDAPSPLKETLLRIAGIARWQGYADMTGELLDRLAREAVDQARNAAAAEGFFSAVTTVDIDRRTKPATVTLKVDTGEPTRIDKLRITVEGPAASDAPLGTDAIASLTRDWVLPAGAQFRQSTWTAAKDQAVATLTASPYAAARIAKSEAFIDPERRSADLTVELASGPRFTFGDLEITGLGKYPESIVRNYSTIKPGEPYSERELDRFLRRLNGSGYFASVQAAIAADVDHPDDSPIRIAVIEAPAKRVEGGVGYSTDVQFRANASYRDVNFDGKGLQMLVEGRIETKIQTATARFSLPPNHAGWIGTFGAGATRTDIESLITRTAFAGTRWRTVEEHNEQAASATFYLDEQQPSGAPNVSAHALYPEYERYWRRVDYLIAPTTGWMAALHAGGGIPGASTRSFGRVVGRFAAWAPLDRKNELQFRAEGGAVIAGSRDGVPSTLLFRTGGDTTVRGYAFDGLGVKDGDATVPGRYYAVASGEAIHWINDAWGVATFLDAGNATDSLSGFRFALGYGAGVRVRTPLGPFRLDVAYGQDVRDVRVHFSVGISF